MDFEFERVDIPEGYLTTDLDRLVIYGRRGVDDIRIRAYNFGQRSQISGYSTDQVGLAYFGRDIDVYKAKPVFEREGFVPLGIHELCALNTVRDLSLVITSHSDITYAVYAIGSPWLDPVSKRYFIQRMTRSSIGLFSHDIVFDKFARYLVARRSL